MANGLRPEPILTYAEWAAERFYLPPAAKLQGVIDLSFVPYLIEPLEFMSWTSIIRQDFAMKGIQIAWTTGYEIIGHANVDMFRKPMIMYFGNAELASEFVKSRFKPGIENNPLLKGKIEDRFNKKDRDTLGLWMLPGGIPMKFTGGKTEKAYRTFTAAIIIMDDIDGFDRDVGARKGVRISDERKGQGSPIELALNRKNARFGDYKFSASGSPTDEETSLIWEHVKKHDLRYFRCKCPFCGQPQTLHFWRMRHPKKTKLKHVTLECARCNRLIPESLKFDMMQLKNGAYWSPSKESEDPTIVSRQISSAYSLLGYNWDQMYTEFLDASKEAKAGNLRKLITFYNTKLGIPWKNKPLKKRIQHTKLYEKRENYKKVPKEALILTQAFDVQDDRIERLVCGFGENGDIFGIEYEKIYGDTLIEYGMPGSLYDRIEELAKLTYENEFGGKQPILQTVIDMGFRSIVVSPFLIQMANKDIPIAGIFGGTGRDKKKMFVSAPTMNKYGVMQWEINVDEGKTMIDRKLKTGLAHFSQHYSFNEQFFRGVTSEKYDEKKGGWEKTGTHARNEPFDLLNYTNAGICIYANNQPIDWESFRVWNQNGCANIFSTPETGVVSKGIQ